MTEIKLFYTVCATMFMYGLGSYMQLGSFVLPLPFFEMGILLICIYFGIKVWSLQKRLAILFLAYGIAQFLAIDYNYSYFLSDQNLELISKGILTDLFKILTQLLLLPIIFLQNKQVKFLSSNISLGIFFAFILFSLIVPFPIYSAILISYLIIQILKKNELFANSLSFWIYIPLFILARELSLYFL